MNDDPGPLRRAVADLSPEQRALLTAELARRRTRRRQSVPVVARTPGENRFRASPGQERLFFLHELAPDATTYHVPVLLRMRGRLRVETLCRALNALVARHEALRTGFAVDPAAGLVQVVLPATEVSVEVTVASAAAAEAEQAALRFLAAPFGLSKPPLLRAALWRVDQAAPSGWAPHEPGEWLLALCVHHIVVDGWSLSVLIDDLSAAYRAFVAGRKPDLAENALQYADYALWQRERLADPAVGERLEHWRDRLSGVSPAELPADRPRPLTQSFGGGTVRLGLPADVVTAMRRLGDGEQATTFMVLAAAMAVTVGRWSGHRETVIGTPVAGRPLPELERLVGFFVNTVPLPITVDGDESFRHLLRRARATCLAAFDHQDVPFERIVRKVQGEGRAGRSALVRTLLALGNVPRAPLKLPDLDIERLDVPRNSTDLDLSVELDPSGDGSLSGCVVFSTDLFEATTVERFAASLRSVCAAAAADPDRPVAELPLMPRSEHDRLVQVVSGAAVPPLPPEFVHHRFARRARRTPDAVAVVADRAGVPAESCPAVSYRNLDAASNRLARWLRDRGTAVEDRIAVHLERGPALVTALLAVMKAGAVYVPLDPQQPRDRLEHIAREVRPALVLSSRQAAGDTPGSQAAEVVAVEELDAELAVYPATAPDVPLSPDNAAYVLHTSGSTGAPKGVVVTHRALSNRLRWMCDAFGFGPADVVLHRTSLGFDPSLWELCVPLMTGGRLVLAEPYRHGDPRYVLDVVARHRVTACDFVPSLMRPVLAEPGVRERMASLRAVVSGGEELTAELAARFHELLPCADLHNFYGPTEAAIDVSAHRVAAPARPPVPIGAPITGAELHVLDERLQPQPVGVPGELFVGGVQVARGYLGRPGQTAERFVPHPFRAGGRLYRTGDRARWRADGTLEYLGRLDRQVKIRGNRVEPAEVESALRDHPDVREAVVLARPGPRGEPELTAYLTLVPGAPEPGEDALRRFLGRRLPAAMIPASFSRLAALPLTSSGKVDTAALPSAGGTRIRPAGASAPPQDALHEVLAGIWADELQVADVGIHDDFFALGGHSILATLIVAQIRDLFRFELPLRSFVEATTVAALADLVRERGAQAGVDADRVAALILEVQRMPDAEVTARLHD